MPSSVADVPKQSLVSQAESRVWAHNDLPVTSLHNFLCKSLLSETTQFPWVFVKCRSSGCYSESLFFLGWKAPVDDDDGEDDNVMAMGKAIIYTVLTTCQGLY